MADQFELFEAHTFSGEQGETLPYRLMRPQHEKPGETYPLVLFLHGSAGNGDDNIGNLTDTDTTELMATDAMREKHPAYVLVPHCPVDHSWIKNIRRSTFPEVKHLLLGMLDEVCAGCAVDMARIYVTGLSRGGFGVFGMVAARPDLFAAAVPLCGGWDPADASLMASVPFWVFHGAADHTVETDYSRNMVKALSEAGADVTYTEYPGVGHNCWTQGYGTEAVWEWLFAQKHV